MITAHAATMQYPVPKRYREYLFHPLRPPRRVQALSEVDLQIDNGACVALVGPNGAGKTTLLKLLGGLLYPTTGSVRIDGLDTVEHNLSARRKVGLVINEDRSFYWRLTGIENLEFFGTLDNLHGSELRERTAVLLKLVGLAAAGDKRVSDYSSGMRQRLAIARGLLVDPEVLLLDEPTRSLDPLGAREIRRLISGEIHAERTRTIVVATNQLADVSDLCDRLLMIHHGSIVRSSQVTQSTEQEITELYQQTMHPLGGNLEESA